MPTLQQRRLLLANTPDRLAGLVRLGLFAAYAFDDGGGQMAIDYAGNGYHGRLGSASGADTADPLWQAGGLKFDGINDYVAVVGLAATMPTTACTVMSAQTITPSAHNSTLGASGASSTRVGLAPHVSNTIYWDFGNPGTNGRLAYTPAPLLTGWHTLAGTAGGGAMALYVDGVSKATAAASGTYVPTAGDMTIGRLTVDYSVALHGFLLIYNRVLTAAEVAQNHAALTTILAARGVALP